MFRVKYNLKEFKQFANLLKNTDYYKIMKIGMRAAMMKAHEIVVGDYLMADGRAPVPNPYDTKLRTDSGITAATVGTRVKEIGKKIQGQIFSGQKHMPAHEFGADIPERIASAGKVLPITLPDGTVIFRKRAKGFHLKERAPMRHGIEAALPSMANILINIYEKEMRKKVGFK